MKITRQDYMKSSGNLHRQYYAQFVNNNIKNYITIVIGLDKIIQSKNEHFNDIPLQQWDRAAEFAKHYINIPLLKELGESAALSTLVCILKEAAAQIREENKE